MIRYPDLGSNGGQQTSPQRGIFWGPMFSGKTSELQNLLHRFRHAGQKVVLFNPSHNTRDNELVSSHDGRKAEAIVFSDIAEIVAYVHEHQPQIVLIEEAQFIDELWSLCNELAKCGVHVFMAALNEDYTGQPWPKIRDMLHTCQVYQTFAVCKRCGSMRASHSALLKPNIDGGNIVIGGDDRFEALCDACFDAHLRS